MTAAHPFPRPLRRAALAAALVASAGLVGCRATGAGAVEVHEAVLYGGTQDRVVWIYGGPDAARTTLTIDGHRATLGDSSAAGGLPGTLSVDGHAAYRVKAASLSAPFAARPEGSRVQITASTPAVTTVYATDGERWTRLSGTSGMVDMAPATSLRGAGRLTDAEADALGAALLHQGPLYVAVLAEDSIPDTPLTLDPAPGTYRRTGLYVAAPPAASAPKPSPVTATTGDRVTYTELSSGTNARVSAPTVQVATTDAEVATLYTQAHGRQTDVPTPASVGSGTVVGIFLGQRNTGGYGVRVVRASASGGVLTLTVQLRVPGPGSITTQAITSPWTLVRVEGTYTRVDVVDEFGQPLPVGGATDR
ncbi:hypothetical protein HNQ07_000815 [Deinococcus metalli]|uniref:PrcB C-terminal domain-containing protein n=1 Tax=Deinococcus metalli TaxID=1141878 RepID=A0A7W8KC47_9DEIO|nr:protease complex subunit PrcB family protein [Deinococcus metalli]MBB5375371.1 hypothetical protein [Deinococcus metalli]GHF29816.1 hypothetical protein GCM10017781_02250 [Deinococcus metalli]